MTIDEIAAYWHVPIEAVEEAIAYCRTSPKEIELDQREEELRLKLSGMDRPGHNGNPKVLTAEDHAAIQDALNENIP